MDVNTRYLRHKPTGILYVDQPAFANRPDFEPVQLEAPAAEPAAPAEAAPRRKRGEPTADELFAQEAAANAAAVSADASRNLP